MKEKRIEHEIIEALRTLGWAVTKTSAYRHAKGVTSGTPDLYCSHATRKVRAWIEVKRPSGTVSDAQAHWHELERAAGGTVIVARSAAEAVEALNQLNPED